MNNLIIENHKKYLERMSLFKKYGFDIVEERKTIIERAKPINGKILEIGVGKGHFALALAQENYNFISIDKSGAEIEFARLNIEYYNLTDKIEFKIMDAEKLEFPDNYFETVFSVCLLHHLENPYNFINEALRVLKKSGKFILSDFSEKGLELINKIHQSEGREHPENKVYVNDIRKYLALNNIKFKDIDTDLHSSIIIYP